MVHLKNALILGLCFISLLLTAQSNFELGLEYLIKTALYTSTDLNDIIISDEYESRHNGTTHLYLQQRYQGIEILGAIANFNIKSGAVLRAKGKLEQSLDRQINTSQPVLDASEALQQVLQSHQVQLPTPAIIHIENSPDQFTRFDRGEIALEPLEARLAYFKEANQLMLAWEISWYEKSAKNAWLSYINAVSGEILEEFNQVIHCTFHKEKHIESSSNKAPQLAKIKLVKNANENPGSYRVFAAPLESPNHGNRTLVTSPWDYAGDAGVVGWHNDGNSTYTHTRGNNVDAYEDHDNSNGPTGGNTARADGGLDLEFDFPLDLTTDAPTDNPDPCITNLFYWTNLMHDVWYQYGFDEPAGNYQKDNLGRGGAATDYVRAEAQDGGGTNNANFYTLSDGNSPRMQMYIWRPDVDSLQVNSPENIAGLYEMRPADFGGNLNNLITGEVVEVDDGSSNPSFACETLVNAAEISGNIALIDRGTCEFGTKSLNAQNAGAIAVIICNDEPGLVNMAVGFDGFFVTIPVVMIHQDDCATIRAELNNNLNISLLDIEDPLLDGALDNAIICHEYGHGISLRLTGGPDNVYCLNNAEQMGEGWSDFFGIWMTTQSSDNHYDRRGILTYVLGETPEDDGIRPAPYTTDMTINAYTYNNLNDANISQPHGIGFIWCTMLWDLNWAFIKEYGFSTDFYNGDGGNNQLAQLIIDAMKLQPCRPGFVDARDAILDADADNNAGVHEHIIWNVFARRGLGYSADQGSNLERDDQTEAFDLPPWISPMTEEELFGELPLAVELSFLRAIPHQEEKLIEILWSTSSETNNSGFKIERKSAADNRFEAIAWVPGKLNSESLLNYVYHDLQVQPGLEYYYRLRLIDVEGKEELSEIVHAKLTEQSTDIKVFPNPSRGLSTVIFSENLSGPVDFKIFNTSGRLLGNQKFETTGGAELEVDLSNQPDGIYMLEFEVGSKHFVKRLLKE